MTWRTAAGGSGSRRICVRQDRAASISQKIRMKKDHLRDYATNAFRTYAAAGRPNDLRIERYYEPYRYSDGKSADICAVYDTLRELNQSQDGKLTASCLDIVYFTEPIMQIRKNDISARVIYAAHALSMDESAVYRRLKHARELFAVKRKLNSASSRPL